MRLHYGSVAIYVDDQSRKEVSLPVHEAETGVVFADQTESAAKRERR